MNIKTGMNKDYTVHKEKNSHDAYSARIVSYSEDWANLMELQMANGKSISECAESTSYEANTDGITEFMYGCAVSILAFFWQHGEELRCWHNLKTQMHNEGEIANKGTGVLNPALIILNPK